MSSLDRFCAIGVGAGEDAVLRPELVWTCVPASLLPFVRLSVEAHQRRQPASLANLERSRQEEIQQGGQD